MQRVHRTAPVWFWLVLIAFMATRLADAHLHLCFDGQEPPSALHVSDGPAHGDPHHTNTEHADRDVEVFDTALTKKLSNSDDPLLFVFVVAVFFVVSTAAGTFWRPRVDAPLFARSLLVLKPPLRGPPR